MDGGRGGSGVPPWMRNRRRVLVLAEAEHLAGRRSSSQWGRSTDPGAWRRAPRHVASWRFAAVDRRRQPSAKIARNAPGVPSSAMTGRAADKREASGPRSPSRSYKRLNTFFASYTKNISKGGTFIRTSKPLESGGFTFVLSLPTRTSSSRSAVRSCGSRAKAEAGKAESRRGWVVLFKNDSGATRSATSWSGSWPGAGEHLDEAPGEEVTKETRSSDEKG